MTARVVVQATGRTYDRATIGSWRYVDLRDLQSQLDRKTLRLLEGVIVYELGWCEFGKRLRVHASTSKRRAIAAIKTLGTAW